MNWKGTLEITHALPFSKDSSAPFPRPPSPFPPPSLSLLFPQFPFLPPLSETPPSLDRPGVYSLTGVPESAHSLLIGENGLNVAVLRALNVKATLSPTNVKLEGAAEDVHLAYDFLLISRS